MQKLSAVLLSLFLITFIHASIAEGKAKAPPSVEKLNEAIKLYRTVIRHRIAICFGAKKSQALLEQLEHQEEQKRPTDKEFETAFLKDTVQHPKNAPIQFDFSKLKEALTKGYEAAYPGEDIKARVDADFAKLTLEYRRRRYLDFIVTAERIYMNGQFKILGRDAAQNLPELEPAIQYFKSLKKPIDPSDVNIVRFSTQATVKKPALFIGVSPDTVAFSYYESYMTGEKKQAREISIDSTVKLSGIPSLSGKLNESFLGGKSNILIHESLFEIEPPLLFKSTSSRDDG